MRPINSYKKMNNADLGRAIEYLIELNERSSTTNDHLHYYANRWIKEDTATCDKLKQSEAVLLAENARLSTEVSRLRDNLATSEQQLHVWEQVNRSLAEELQSMVQTKDELFHENDLLLRKDEEFQRKMFIRSRLITDTQPDPSHITNLLSSTPDGYSIDQQAPPKYSPRDASTAEGRQ